MGLTTVRTLSSRLSTLPSVNPMAVETSAGNTEEDINFEVNKGGDVYLTCGARARLVVAGEAVRVWRERTTDAVELKSRGTDGGRRAPW